jgi:hypothetical protein
LLFNGGNGLHAVIKRNNNLWNEYEKKPFICIEHLLRVPDLGNPLSGEGFRSSRVDTLEDILMYRNKVGARENIVTVRAIPVLFTIAISIPKGDLDKVPLCFY